MDINKSLRKYPFLWLTLGVCVSIYLAWVDLSVWCECLSEKGFLQCDMSKLICQVCSCVVAVSHLVHAPVSPTCGFWSVLI